MSEVTVKQLAKDIDAPVERLLKQITDAGLSARDESGVVSDVEKQTLLDFLKKSHGESEGEPQQITLKRKTTSTLKMSAGQGKSKTVNVEVRKKRTYVKRPDVSLELEQQKKEEAEKAAKLAEEVALKKAREEEEAKAQADAKEKERLAKEAEENALASINQLTGNKLNFKQIESKLDSLLNKTGLGMGKLLKVEKLIK